jgi:hypothetical protein
LIRLYIEGTSAPSGLKSAIEDNEDNLPVLGVFEGDQGYPILFYIFIDEQ